jgi:hypothetical protein
MITQANVVNTGAQGKVLFAQMIDLRATSADKPALSGDSKNPYA